MEENPSEMTITLKKRPRHLPYVIPYMKPIRIPARSGYHNQSKKGSSGRNRYNEGFFNNLPSPRAELLVAPNITLKISKYVIKNCKTYKTVSKFNVIIFV